MRDTSEIEDRIRTLLCAELDRRVSEATKRLPRRCVNNHQQTLDARPKIDGEMNENYNRIIDKRGLPVVQTIGLCMLGAYDPTQWNGTICEDPIDAQRCPDFTPKQNKEGLWQEFAEQLSDLAWIREHMPDVAALYWTISEAATVRLPWWKRLWFWAMRVKVEPQLPPFDAVQLLPPAA